MLTWNWDWVILTTVVLNCLGHSPPLYNLIFRKSGIKIEKIEKYEKFVSDDFIHFFKMKKIFLRSFVKIPFL